MADQKISQLTAHTSPTGSDELAIVSGGTTKKITYGNIVNKVSRQDLTLNSGSFTYLGNGSYDNASLLKVVKGDDIASGDRGVTMPDATLYENSMVNLAFDYSWNTGANKASINLEILPSGSQLLVGINQGYPVAGGKVSSDFAGHFYSFYSDGTEWYLYNAQTTS